MRSSFRVLKFPTNNPEHSNVSTWALKEAHKELQQTEGTKHAEDEMQMGLFWSCQIHFEISSSSSFCLHWMWFVVMFELINHRQDCGSWSYSGSTIDRGVTWNKETALTHRASWLKCLQSQAMLRYLKPWFRRMSELSYTDSNLKRQQTWGSPTNPCPKWPFHQRSTNWSILGICWTKPATVHLLLGLLH